MISIAMVSLPLSNISIIANLFYLGNIRVTDEPWVAQLMSHSISGREDSFGCGVRARDGKCVLTGRVNRLAAAGSWDGFQAAHIFPLEHENIWIQNNYGRWITNMQGVIGNSRINSVQNGLLVSSNLHTAFDQYLFSINPDVSNLMAGLAAEILTL